MNSVVDVTHSFENIYTYMYERICTFGQGTYDTYMYPTRRFIWVENSDFNEFCIVVSSFQARNVEDRII